MCVVAVGDGVLEMSVLRLDHLVGGVALKRKVAGTAELLARHRLHEAQPTSIHSWRAYPILRDRRQNLNLASAFSLWLLRLATATPQYQPCALSLLVGGQ